MNGMNAPLAVGLQTGPLFELLSAPPEFIELLPVAAALVQAVRDALAGLRGI